MKFEDLFNKVIGCAIEVHKTLGPGLLESAYEKCLSYELTKAGIRHEIQKALPVCYRDVMIDCGYRIDLLIENKIIVELKTVDSLLPIHEAQILTYMKLASMPIGLLINFNVKRLHDGIKQFVI